MGGCCAKIGCRCNRPPATSDGSCRCDQGAMGEGGGGGDGGVGVGDGGGGGKGVGDGGGGKGVGDVGDSGDGGGKGTAPEGKCHDFAGNPYDGVGKDEKAGAGVSDGWVGHGGSGDCGVGGTGVGDSLPKKGGGDPDPCPPSTRKRPAPTMPKPKGNRYLIDEMEQAINRREECWREELKSEIREHDEENCLFPEAFDSLFECVSTMVPKFGELKPLEHAARRLALCYARNPCDSLPCAALARAYAQLVCAEFEHRARVFAHGVTGPCGGVGLQGLDVPAFGR